MSKLLNWFKFISIVVIILGILTLIFDKGASFTLVLTLLIIAIVFSIITIIASKKEDNNTTENQKQLTDYNTEHETFEAPVITNIPELKSKKKTTKRKTTKKKTTKRKTTKKKK
jgi:ABC-type transport system involved in cytochrome bd biosynthesis fused ATPase/permease subunit